MVGPRHRSAAAVAENIYAPEETAPQRSFKVRRRAGRRRKSGTVISFAGTIVLLCGMLLVLGMRQAAIARLGYEIDTAKKQLAALEQERAMLEGQVALLKTPDRIETTALDMGMAYAEERRIMNVAVLDTVDAATSVGKSVIVALPQPPSGTPDGEPVAGGSGRSSLMAAAGERILAWLTGGQSATYDAAE